MVSRNQSCLRTFLSAIALMIILAALAPQPVQAKNPYDFTDRTEGDPGDGVLDPSRDDSESSGKSPAAASATAGTFIDAWYLPLGEFYLVPVYLPGGPMGRGTVIFLPRVWSHTALTTRLSEGRWQHAP